MRIYSYLYMCLHKHLYIHMFIDIQTHTHTHWQICAPFFRTAVEGIFVSIIACLCTRNLWTQIFTARDCHVCVCVYVFVCVCLCVLAEVVVRSLLVSFSCIHFAVAGHFRIYDKIYSSILPTLGICLF